MVDEQGATTLDFTSGSAVLDRFHDVLTLDGKVHVLRDMQVMDADRATAHLAPNDEFVTFIEMRGNSRVAGGGGTLDAMSARDIDLDYTDDGKLLERAALIGMAGLTMTGANGAAGRQLIGDSIEVKLAADGAVTSATGRENVRHGSPGGRREPGANGPGESAGRDRSAWCRTDRRALRRRGRVPRGRASVAQAVAPRIRNVSTWCCRRMR